AEGLEITVLPAGLEHNSINLRRVNPSTEIQNELVTAPLALDISGATAGQEMTVSWRYTGVPSDAPDGDYDLVIVRRAEEFVGEVSSPVGEIHLYAWGQREDDQTFGEESMRSGDIFYIWKDPAGDKSASSEIAEGFLLEPESFAGAPDVSAPLHVVFIDGLDPFDDGGIDFPGAHGKSMHWWKYARPDDSSRLVLQGLTDLGVADQVKLWWFSYPSITAPIFDLNGRAGSGAILSQKLYDQVLQTNSDAKFLFVGYSGGALVARSAFSDLRYHNRITDDNIAGFISLNGTNTGAEFVNILAGYPVVSKLVPLAKKPGILHLASPYRMDYTTGGSNPKTIVLELGNEKLAYVNETYAYMWNNSTRCIYLGSHMTSGYDKVFDTLDAPALYQNISGYYGGSTAGPSTPAHLTNLYKVGGRATSDGVVALYSQMGRPILGQWPSGFNPDLATYNHFIPHVAANKTPSTQLRSDVKDAIKRQVLRFLQPTSETPDPPTEYAVSHDD
ncbi:MAG: hypothetical protein M3R04_06270, partial [bacterium]|nr:hypothetical protein [bacterium]